MVGASVPTALNLLLCAHAKAYGSALSIIDGGMQFYPATGEWMVAGTYDGPANVLAGKPAAVSIHTGNRRLWKHGLQIDVPDSEVLGPEMIRMPIALPLPEIPEDEPNGLYFVRVEIGGKVARLPFMVADRATAHTED